MGVRSLLRRFRVFRSTEVGWQQGVGVRCFVLSTDQRRGKLCICTCSYICSAFLARAIDFYVLEGTYFLLLRSVSLSWPQIACVRTCFSMNH